MLYSQLLIVLFWMFFFLLIRLISEALQKMKGKIPEIAGSHVSSRVLQVIFGNFVREFLYLHLWFFPLKFVLFMFLSPQTCVKYCSQAERDAVFEELQPHFLSLADNTYAVHLVKKMLDNGMI